MTQVKAKGSGGTVHSALSPFLICKWPKAAAGVRGRALNLESKKLKSQFQLCLFLVVKLGKQSLGLSQPQCPYWLTGWTTPISQDCCRGDLCSKKHIRFGDKAPRRPKHRPRQLWAMCLPARQRVSLSLLTWKMGQEHQLNMKTSRENVSNWFSTVLSTWSTLSNVSH